MENQRKNENMKLSTVSLFESLFQQITHCSRRTRTLAEPECINPLQMGLEWYYKFALEQPESIGPFLDYFVSWRRLWSRNFHMGPLWGIAYIQDTTKLM